MPALPNIVKRYTGRETELVAPPRSTVYYLSNPPLSPSSLRQIPPPTQIQPIPTTSLIFSLTHPNIVSPSPSSSNLTIDATKFFLTCLPDPIGFLYHSAIFIQSNLKPSSTPDHVPDSGSEWRHQLIQLVLEDEPGLAATSGGKIHVSLQWVESVMKDVHSSKRDTQAAIKEFKGVLLHELVHTIQHDGSSTCPGWLIESIADYIRLLAHLDPPHWRSPGQGRVDKGWEEAYDSGARFLTWLTIPDHITSNSISNSNSPSSSGLHTSMSDLSINSTPSIPSLPHATQYPDMNRMRYPESRRPLPGKKRRGPFPELVRLLDTRLKVEKWDDSWWEEMTGASLESLWAEYLAYYAVI